MLVLLFCFSFSALVGVDIGSESLRAAILRPGKPIEILLDGNSKRIFSSIMTIIPRDAEIPGCINYTDVDDFDFVMNDPIAIRKYPNSTIRHWSNFIAKLDRPQLRNLAKERKFYAPITSHFNNRVLVSGVFPEVVFHRTLPQINASALQLDENAVIKSSVFAVPKFWPQQERDAIRSIARNLKFSPFIVESGKAAATYFALEHQKHFSKKPLNVAFFDFGASNIQILIAQFHKKPSLRIKEVAYDFDDTIGGRDLDILIFNLLAEKYGEALNARNEQILLSEANKIKHRLTTDNKVAGYIENLNFNYVITRDEFENTLQPTLTKISNMIKQLVQSNQVDRVQMLGGSSRIPIVQTVVQEAFGVDKLMFSMNAEESSAYGAAYIGASMSSDFMIPSIEYESLSLFDVQISYEKSPKIPFNESIIKPGETHWISFNVENKKFPIGSSIYLAWSNTNDTTTITQTKDGLYRFKNGTQGNSHPWKYQTLDIAEEIEKREIAKTKLEETVNKLETLLLDTKMLLNEESSSNLMKMSTENERKALSNAVEVTDRWFLKQQTFEQETVENRLNMLQDAVGSVMCRVQNAEVLPEMEKNMSNLIKDIEKTISKKWAYKAEKKRPSRFSIRSLLRMIVDYNQWHDELESIQKTLRPIDNPILLWSEIRAKYIEILNYYNRLQDIAMGKTEQEKENIYVYPKSPNLDLK